MITRIFPCLHLFFTVKEGPLCTVEKDRYLFLNEDLIMWSAILSFMDNFPPVLGCWIPTRSIWNTIHTSTSFRKQNSWTKYSNIDINLVGYFKGEVWHQSTVAQSTLSPLRTTFSSLRTRPADLQCCVVKVAAPW